MRTVFDFGMYDGADTEYFLDLGFKVIAVEANPVLVAQAAETFAEQIDGGRLILLNVAIAEAAGSVELSIAGGDLGSSSTIENRTAGTEILGKYRVSATTLQDIVSEHGVPYFLKVDLEGLDIVCVRALSRDSRPEFLSVEIAPESFEEAVEHLAEVGYKRFKIIGQRTLREISNERNLYDRCSRRLLYYMGFSEPKYVRRKGRFFNLGHSSGPAPWDSDGQWGDLGEVRDKWRAAQPRMRKQDWYDLHATAV